MLRESEISARGALADREPDPEDRQPGPYRPGVGDCAARARSDFMPWTRPAIKESRGARVVNVRRDAAVLDAQETRASAPQALRCG